MSDTLVRVERSGALATLVLDSPHNRNALSSALTGQLLDHLAAAVADDAVRVIVLSHTGRVFCSGADLKETAAVHAAADHPSAAAGAAGPVVPAGRMGELLAAVWECPKPVVARVGGPARAGGVGLVAAADIAVCADDATFAFTEVRLGVVPAVISATVLPRLTPRAAVELFLTGDTFDGLRARDVGLVTASVPAAELDVAVARYVASLLLGAPTALAVAKQLTRRRPTDPAGLADLDRRAADPIRAELAALTELSVRFFGSPDGREGVRSFVEKRAPSWARNASDDVG